MKKMKLTVEFEVTHPQAIALIAMFEYWNTLAGMGASRKVGFFVDGDGDFKPNCNYRTDKAHRAITDDLRKAAIRQNNGGHRLYDYDWLFETAEAIRKDGSQTK